MTKTNTIIVALGLIMVATMVASIIVGTTQTVLGSAPSGLPASVGTSSPFDVGPNNAPRAFATSTCASRTITTEDQAVRIVFSGAKALFPTAEFGTLQLASTTVTYDSGQYGCEAVFIYGQGATSTLWLVETR